MPKVEKNKLRGNAFFAVLLLYVSVLPYSEALVSISAGLLLFQALVLASWKHPSVRNAGILPFVLITSVFVVYLLGLVQTEDLSFGLYELRKVVFWVVLPTAFFFSPRLTSKQFYTVLLVFCLAVLSASVFAFVRLIFKDFFQITNFRDISIISHIRFSFQVVLALIVIAWLLMAEKKLPLKFNRTLLVAVLIWLTAFLVVLKSLTGILAFIGTTAVLFFIFAAHIKNKSQKISAIVLVVLVFITPVVYVGLVWRDFYDVEDLNPDTAEKFTASGNPYYFDFSSAEKENGNWVKAYISEKELRKEWNKRSEADYDSLDENGYAYSATLIRYLTSKGLRKDSVGMSKLTESDIRAVENGIANYIYADRGFSIYPRIYQTIWELDRYLMSGNPNNQSFSQRIEYFKASLHLISQNPWLGIGTGNWQIKYTEAYDEMNSQLKPENQGPAHNQYLNYMVKFGIVGFAYIFFALIFPVFLEGNQKNLVFWLFFAAYAIANLGDANFESHMGLSFFCFFYSLLLWHSPKELRNLPF